MTNTEFQIPETNENFEALLNEQFGDNGITGSVVKGTIVRVTPDFAIVDVGLKSEGRIPLREFGQNAELKAGDKVEVYVDRYEDKDGQIVLSREKARREEVWQDLEKSLNAGERVNGVIFGRVKGGFTVDLNGADCFPAGFSDRYSSDPRHYSADGHFSAVPDFENGQGQRQHCCFPPRCSGRNPRRSPCRTD